ncbi:MAG TPA: PaaI family thioesterase [Solirubrobacteraceae bacterium]|nr:PaaI family thioesterase [Solirubrobacteraceae bacterium]
MEQRSAAPEVLREMIPFAATVGIELLETGPDLVRGRLAWSHERTTTADVMHGGAIMTLADTCGGVCAFLNLPDGAQGTATVESKTNFLRAITSGAANATARPLHKGRSLIVVETEVTREDGKLAAKITQTQTYLYARD